jgi:hypothetical protein
MWKLQRKSASLEFSSKMLRDYSADAFRKYALKLAMILQGIYIYIAFLHSASKAVISPVNSLPHLAFSSAISYGLAVPP